MSNDQAHTTPLPPWAPCKRPLGCDYPDCECHSQTTDPEVWWTLEQSPRLLIVRGRSAIDSDCLVAYLGGDPDKKALWIVDGGGLIENCLVVGLGVRASKVKEDAHADTPT